jgi:uncharacterized cupin superfamily protein/glutathione S-transferase
MTQVRIVGRGASHFTRVAVMFAHELDVPFEQVHVADLTSLEASQYGGNPTLKIPAADFGGDVVFGAENVCRRLAEVSPRGASGLVWPEDVRTTRGRNAHELVQNAMAAEVTLVLAPGLGKVSAENPFVVKVTRGLEGALAWLEANLDDALEDLPKERTLSYLEVAAFCLVEHVAFRGTVSLEPYPRLRAFATAFGARDSARKSPYRYTEPRRPHAEAFLTKPALDPRDLPPRTTSAYPTFFRERVLPREKRALGDALGLTRFGANLTTLFPGKISALRHHHSSEEELVFVLEGEVVLHTDEGEQVLRAGTCAGFPRGVPNGHHLENRSARSARYLEIGTREADDEATYPDDDVVARKVDGTWRFFHKDGTPY